MGNFRFRTLDQYRVGGTDEEMRLSMPLTRSPRGLIYRSCPNQNCSPGLFLLGDPPSQQTIDPAREALVRRQPGTPGMTCPYCGHDDEDSNFTFEGDVEAAKELIAWAAMKDVGDYLGSAFEDMARSVNRSRGAITMKYTKGSEEPKPLAWRVDLLRNLTCDTCQRAYGVYAIGLFCPDCGVENINVHFAREIELIEKQIQIAQGIQDEELSYRLLGNAHEDVLTALETYLKTLFRFAIRQRYPERYEELCSKRAIRNSFQNIERGRKQLEILGIDPFAGLGGGDLDTLRRSIERRHVVGHNLSMADEAYVRAEETGGTGETVRLLAEDISGFCQVANRVVRDLIEQLPELRNAKPKEC